jgi:azurin
VLFVGVKHPKTKYIYVHPDDARIVHRSHEIGFGVRMARTHVANEMKALRGYA